MCALLRLVFVVVVVVGLHLAGLCLRELTQCSSPKLLEDCDLLVVEAHVGGALRGYVGHARPQLYLLLLLLGVVERPEWDRREQGR